MDKFSNIARQYGAAVHDELAWTCPALFGRRNERLSTLSYFVSTRSGYLVRSWAILNLEFE